IVRCGGAAGPGGGAIRKKMKNANRARLISPWLGVGGWGGGMEWTRQGYGPSGGCGVKTQRAATARARGFWRTREQMVVHADHHRHEDQRVVDEMQLEPRNEQLNDARGLRGAEQRMAGDDLPLQQGVLDVMPELDDQSSNPPASRASDEARQKRPNARQH